jgi:hypothetical protein
MPIRFARSIARSIVFVAACAVLCVALPDSAQAQAATGKKKTEGCLISFDGTAKMVVKDEKTKKEMTFDVKQATSVLDKEGTVATKNGRKAQLVDLEVNRPVIVYWKDKGGSPFASKVDAPDPTDAETDQLDADVMENFACKME